MLSIDFSFLENQLFINFFFRIELGKVNFETIFDILGWFFRNCWITSIVLLLFFVSYLLNLSCFLSVLGASRHHYSRCTIHAHFPNLEKRDLECCTESCWLWIGIFKGYTLGLLPLWELSNTDFVGIVMGRERLIFLKKLLTITADDLRG